MYKAFILSVLAYIVLSMAIAVPWHIVWFADLYHENGWFTRDEPIIPLGMMAMLTQAVVFAYVYPFYYKGGHPVLTGIKFSLILGLLVYSVMGFTHVAKIEMQKPELFLLLHTVFQFIQFTLVGAAIGFIHGQKEDI